MRNFTGYSGKTKEGLLLNAGAFFKNFDIDKDTYESAMAAGKCIGATQGGGSFSAAPETRNIEIDGADDIIVIDKWVTTLVAKLIEVKPGTLSVALGSGNMTERGENYYEIRAKRLADDSDRIDNITWLGNVSGSNEPVIIQIYNAMASGGLTLNVAPKSQSVIEVTFTAMSDPDKNPEDIDFAPFRIFYPKALARVVFDKITTEDTVITGKGSTGGTVFISGAGIPADTSVKVDSGGGFTVGLEEPLALGAQVTGYQKVGTRRSLDAVVYVAEGEPEDEEDEGE